MPIDQIQHRAMAGNHLNRATARVHPLKKTLSVVKMLYEHDTGKAWLHDIDGIKNIPRCLNPPDRSYVKNAITLTFALRLGTNSSVQRGTVPRIAQQ